jgi:serine protease Do
MPQLPKFLIMSIRLIAILIAMIPAFANAQDRAVPVNSAQIQLSFAPVVQQVSPAIVNIYTKKQVAVRSRISPFMNDPFFSRFFDDSLFGGRMRSRIESTLGSGVIVDGAAGMIVTNAHVINGANEITVVLSDGREFDAELTLADEASDLAVLTIDTQGEKIPEVSLQPSENLHVGDIVLAIGNPFGVGQSVTSGIVSAQGRSTLNINDFNFFIQTDAAINPGNSGGALVALDGSVVGINTAIYSRDGGSLGIGFAVPSEMVATVVAAAKDGQSGTHGIVRPWLGVTAQAITQDIASSLGLSTPRGVLIGKLHSASPLKKAGIRTGDVVTSMNGKPLQDAAEMKFRMATVPMGETASLQVLREGEVNDYNVLAMAPPDSPPRAQITLDGAHPFSGATLANINPAVAVELGITEEEGVVVLNIDRRGAAARLVQPGNILLEINGEAVTSPKQAQKLLKNGPSRQGWLFLISQNGREKRILLR